MSKIKEQRAIAAGILSLVFLMAIIAVSGCGGGFGGRPGNALSPLVSTGRVLTVARVATDPTVDGIVESAWDSATPVTVSLGTGLNDEWDFNCTSCHAQNSSTRVTLKAMYTTNGKLSMLATWNDSTASFTRSSSWTYDATDTDGNAWTKTPSAGQNEDRIAIFWPIGSIQGTTYNTGGCMTKCHTSDTDADGAIADDESFLSSGTADLWHGKAGRALGTISSSQSGITVNATTHEVTAGTITLNGYMEDTQVKNLTAMAGTPTSHGNGRAGDAGSAPASSNSVASRPKYMETNPVDFADAMVLTQAEIDAGETVGSSGAGVTEADAALYWPRYSALSAIVPERILGTPTLSASDIRQACTWSNGWWTCEIQRDLQTATAAVSNTDDVQFTATSEYIFGVAIMNNAGAEAHETSDKYTLKFQ